MSYRSPAARDQGLDEATIRSIPAAAGAADEGPLDPAERAAIRFAELLATDHQRIEGEVMDELRRHFDERQIVELGFAAGSFVAYGRLIHVFGGTWDA